MANMGVSLNGGTPKTPQNDHFTEENPWLLGTTILGNPHLGKYTIIPWILWDREVPMYDCFRTCYDEPMFFFFDGNHFHWVERTHLSQQQQKRELVESGGPWHYKLVIPEIFEKNLIT